MIETEMFAFADVFRAVQRVFPLRGEDHEIKQVMGAYFKALRRYPLSAVQAGADEVLVRSKHFPKPAEWIDAIPSRRGPSVEIETMSEADALDYRRAESLKYDGPPCSCRSCVEAGVSERPLRFVPEQNPDGSDRKVRDVRGDRVVTAGHWAHGQELARWYEARANFWNEMIQKFPGLVNKNATKDVGKQIARVLSPKDRMSRLGEK